MARIDNIVFYAFHRTILIECTNTVEINVEIECINGDTVQDYTIYESRIFTSLTHWGQAMHKCVGDLTITGSDNGLAPAWRQAII